MYEYISGELAEVAPTYAVVDAGGVGYLIHISLETFSKIEHETRVKLFTHYIVREDAQLLYGFAEKVERDLFRLLIGVSGVGGNTARMVLSTYSPKDLQSIISTGNAVLLKNVKGLGMKTAQKIIVELSGKCTGMVEAAAEKAGATVNGVADEAVEALTMLGFSKTAAEKVVRKVVKDDPQLTVEDAVRVALKKM